MFSAGKQKSKKKSTLNFQKKIQMLCSAFGLAQILTDNLVINEPLDGTSHLHVPQTLGPFKLQGVVIVFLDSLARLNTDISVLVSVLESDIKVHVRSNVSVDISSSFFKVIVPVGHEASGDHSPDGGDDLLHPVGELDKVHSPAVMPGAGGVPHGHVARFGSGQLVAAAGLPFG